ncbi:MAG: hypothetical protein MUF26_04105 [Syntrophales bacterium]|jgi:hypothetical protein|nr:hypothetical protein [Syntrophales bacterium]
MKGIAGIVLSILWLGLTGCTYLQGYVDIAKDKSLSNEYQAALNDWTRTKTVHSQFETKVSITSTLKSPAFQRAYIREYERIYSLEAREKQHWEKTQAGLASDFTEFVFYAYIPDKEANDFHRINSVWTVFMVDDQGRQEKPLEIRRIDKITTVTEAFFPYINKYYGAFYSVKFKPLKETNAHSGDAFRKPLALVMTSVLGRVELQWQ